MHTRQVAIHPLPADFYQQPTEIVARALLGQRLVRILPSGERLAGTIVETEAYLGRDDPGAHTYKGRRTERVRSMYLGGGYAYVYFIYGNHFCLNVVTGPRDFGQAVLIRALEPTEGLEQMRNYRPVLKSRELTNGPGKLCQALHITRELDGTTFFGPHLTIEGGHESPSADAIQTTARIGLGCQPAAANWPLRFLWAGNSYVSRRG